MTLVKNKHRSYQQIYKIRIRNTVENEYCFHPPTGIFIYKSGRCRESSINPGAFPAIPLLF